MKGPNKRGREDFENAISDDLETQNSQNFPACANHGRHSKVRGSWFLEATDFCHPQARQIHRCIFAPVTSVNAHYYSVLTTPFDMVNAHYVIIDFRAKFFSKIQNQASDTSRSLPSFSSAPFLLRAVPSKRLGQVYNHGGASWESGPLSLSSWLPE